ncbi:MAG: 5-(carboxyamino)imidazole ribonucleotide mutase [Bacteroidota bacterium]
MRKAIVGIIMGSDSDLPTMQEAAVVLDEFGVPYEMKITSAHRTPNVMSQYAKTAHKRGIKVIIAGAGGAAHLPGMSASHTPLPVIGVPIKTKALEGLDSLLSIAQMPGGVPVATVAIGGGKNAGLLAVQMLAISDKRLLKKMVEYKKKLERESLAKQKVLKNKR